MTSPRCGIACLLLASNRSADAEIVGTAETVCGGGQVYSYAWTYNDHPNDWMTSHITWEDKGQVYCDNN
jgi:hypothetical protein